MQIFHDILQQLSLGSEVLKQIYGIIAIHVELVFMMERYHLHYNGH